MISRDLLARLTFALTATALPLGACGGETSNGTGNTGIGGSGPGAGGANAAGGPGVAGNPAAGGRPGGAGTSATGGGPGTAGTSARAGGPGSGGSGAAGTAGAAGDPCAFVTCARSSCPTGTQEIAPGEGCCGPPTCRTTDRPECPSFLASFEQGCLDAKACVTLTGCGQAGAGGGSGGPQGGSGGEGLACFRPLPEKGPAEFGQACRKPEDCPAQGFPSQCLYPGESVCAGGGGAPEPGGCLDDASCGGVPGSPAYVCQVREIGQSQCTMACKDDTSCGVSQRCDALTGHCVARKCGEAGKPGCPAGSFCQADNTCAYQSCNDTRPCAFGQVCSGASFTCEPKPCKSSDPGSCPDTFTCAPKTGSGEVCMRTSCTCDSQCGASGFCVGGTCYETAGRCTGGVACGRPLLTDDGPRVARLVLDTSTGWNA